ncbi:MAG: hypothetical protein IKK32_00295 [Oscillospiraceae bacterium]|nr:hypothetical protein [Oscillospiraceae bacterium]
MNENLREFFEKSATHVFFCDKKTKAIVWSNNENIRKTIKNSACELFEGRIFPEETGIVCGILHGEPYRYNITETDDCFVIEVLNKNLVSEGMKIDSLRKKFHYEAVNIKEYIYEISRNLAKIEEYFNKEDMYDEMESLAKILNDCYNILRIQKQKEEYDLYMTGKNLESSVFSVTDFIKENEKSLKKFAGRKASVLKFEYGEGDLFISASPKRFSWIVFHTAYIILKNSSDHPAIKISVSCSGNEVAVGIGRNTIEEPESRGVRDCTRYIGGDPFENTTEFEVFKEFCKKYNGRHIAEFTGDRLSAVTLFLPLQEKPQSYSLNSIKEVISDDCFSDLRMNIYEVANLKFIYR